MASIHDRLGPKDSQPGGRGGTSWRGRSRGRGRNRGGGQSGVGPRTRLEGDDESGMMNNDESGYSQGRGGPQRNVRYQRGTGKRRFSPYGNNAEFVSKGKDMGGFEEDKRSVFTRLGGRKPGGTSNAGPRPQRPTASIEGSDWFKVTLPGSSSNNTQWLINQLQLHANVTFQAHNLHILGDKVLFFVDSEHIASQLKEISGSIQSQSGPIKVNVQPSGPPRRQNGSNRSSEGPNPVDGEVQMASTQVDAELLKEALGKRYKPEDRSLNLSDMFHDPILNEAGIRPSLYRKDFTEPILQLISEFCSNLLILNLSNNRLNNLSSYRSLPLVVPHLQGLDLSSNSIRSLDDLDLVTGCNELKHLSLLDNPVMGFKKDFSSLLMEVREKFPNLETLNGQAVARPVKFAVPDVSQLPSALPPVQGGFTGNEATKQVIMEFVKAYFNMFDSLNRDPLYQAYTEEACFSLSIITSKHNQSQSTDHNIKEYIKQSRNFIRITESNRRNSLLQSGRVNIVKALKDLPLSSHILESFTVDVLINFDTLLIFTLTGAFAEVPSSMGAKDPKTVPIRCFSRTFAVVKMNTGMAIHNDQLTIWNPSPNLERTLRKEMESASQGGQQSATQIQGHLSQQAPNSSLANHTSAILSTIRTAPQSASQSVSTLPQASLLDTHPILATLNPQQRETVLQISKETGMNLKYSLRCLIDNEFLLEKARRAFQTLKQKIPSEAFVKDY